MKPPVFLLLLLTLALSLEEMEADYSPVAATLEVPPQGADRPAADPFWTRQGLEDAKEDRSHTIFLGESPDKLACDTTLRAMPDGSWVQVMLGGSDKKWLHFAFDHNRDKALQVSARLPGIP